MAAGQMIVVAVNTNFRALQMVLPKQNKPIKYEEKMGKTKQISPFPYHLVFYVPQQQQIPSIRAVLLISKNKKTERK